MRYPTWNYTKRDWLRNVRKRWVVFRKVRADIRYGSAYFPKEVYEWLSQFEKMDDLMRDYYKGAK